MGPRIVAVTRGTGFLLTWSPVGSTVGLFGAMLKCARILPEVWKFSLFFDILILVCDLWRSKVGARIPRCSL